MFTLIGVLASLGLIFRQTKITDFPVDMIIYRAGVREFLQGGEMYSQPMYAGDLALPFIYPPFGALVLTPLTVFGWMDDDEAGDFIILLSGFLLALCLYLVLRTFLKEASRTEVLTFTALTWPLALLIEPIWLNASFAQINVILMTLVVLDLMPRKRRFLPQGWLIGVAAAIKIAPAAMLLYFLLRRDFKAIFVAIGSAILVTLIAAAARWDATWEYFSTVLLGMGTTSEFGVDSTYTSNSSLKGMVMRFFDSREAMEAHGTILNLIWLVLVVLVIAAGAALMLALIKRGLHTDAVLVNAVVMLLISPVSWSHHWVWLALLLPVTLWHCLNLFPDGWPTYLLGGTTLLWTYLVLTEPPKWWFGDGVDVFTLSVWEKFQVSDFVWLALVYLVALWFSVRRLPITEPAISEAHH
ncbi:Polyprenol-phosphate-mannose-dependent alpha-(1-2)-phosphatidylinositol mannoside mannosyltransferase [Corynebacterium occultum]|uniref:Polyprenol-phosphate-mannose-dependent alpha-(1-2)-phosphatidylinositol mannoside mannosyltransferase n=2 Tax=Corynebacterium occultum TaxID=2675219 RepID=A0A6B8W769_9CORY|nr:Polyprenol-phosphate-mannose-dependent alpha-(1-2)-phosphatidylinositol mannoside mannosyltransferase [Corynebacterium occultum]